MITFLALWLACGVLALVIFWYLSIDLDAILIICVCVLSAPTLLVALLMFMIEVKPFSKVLIKGRGKS